MRCRSNEMWQRRRTHDEATAGDSDDEGFGVVGLLVFEPALPLSVVLLLPPPLLDDDDDGAAPPPPPPLPGLVVCVVGLGAAVVGFELVVECPPLLPLPPVWPPCPE